MFRNPVTFPCLEGSKMPFQRLVPLKIVYLGLSFKAELLDVMQESHALFQLVATLSPSEKRHFRIFAARHVVGDANNYLALLAAVEQYLDEGQDAFLKHYTDHALAQNFTYNAHYLYHLLLRSLQAYRYEGTDAARLRSLLDKVELLMERELLSLADKQLRKLLKEAYALEAFATILDGLQLKRKLLRRIGGKSLWDDLPTLHVAIQEALTKFAHEAMILQCYDEVFLRTQNKLLGESDKLALAEVLAHPLLQDIAEVTTFSGRIAWHFVHAFTHSLHGQAAAAEPHYAHIVALWDAYPQMFRNNPERYAMAIVDLLNCWHQLEKYDGFESMLEIIRTLQRLPRATALRVNWISSNLEVLYYLNTFRLDTATEVVARWEAVLDQNAGRVNDASILSYAFNIALLNFVKEDFSAALKWLNRILNHTRTLARSDVQRFARTFYLIVQIELGNLAFLETELASTRRALQPNGLNALEKATLDLLGKLLLRPQAEWAIHFLRLQADLQHLSSAGSNFFGLEETKIWVDSRVAGRSIAMQLRMTRKS